MKLFSKFNIYLVFFCLCILLPLNAIGVESSTYKIPISLFSGGGCKVVGTNYQMRQVIMGQNMPPMQLENSKYNNNPNSGYVLLRAPNNSPMLLTNQQYYMPDTDYLSYHNGRSVNEIINQSLTAINDIDDEPETGFAITGAKNTNGQWQYSINNGISWNDLNNLSDTNAVLLAKDGENTRLRFVPDEFYNGDDTGWLNVLAWDLTEGINGQTNFDTTKGYAVSINEGIINGGFFQLLETAIPTLSQWGMIIFCSILLLSAMIFLKRTKFLIEKF